MLKAKGGDNQMPYVQRDPKRNVAPNHNYLVGAIKREFDKGLSQAALEVDKDVPVVIEERMRSSDRLQVYVIWRGWSGVREEHRTAAIIDAYEQHFGKEYSKRVVIALGVTPEEAERLGIRE